MIGVDEARACAIAACHARPTERVALLEAGGRVLARTETASEQLVPFARSAMDGYAVRAADTLEAPLRLPLRGAVYARPGAATLEAGTAIAIATGAPIPLGADAVVPDEEAVPEAGSIAIQQATAVGRHIFPAGEDAHIGDPLVRAGTLLDAPKLGFLAAAGIAHVEVVARPRVSILCTGDELVALEATPGHGQIRESNAVVFARAAEELGARVTAVRRVADDLGATVAALAEACAASDLVLTCGGAGAGPRDYVKAALRALGADIRFEAIAMRPSRPTGLAVLNGTVITVLPGNPAAAFVAFQQIVRPAIATLLGLRDVRLPRVRAELRGRLHGRIERTYFAYARVELTENGSGFIVTPAADQCSALTRTAAEANAFAVVPPGSRNYETGTTIDVDVFSWNAFGPS